MVAKAGADKANKIVKKDEAPGYKEKVQHVIEGKFLKTMVSRSKSEVSVQA